MNKFKKVTIYSTPTCPACVIVKNWCKLNEIVYEDINVAADMAEAEKMVIETGQMGVPVTKIEDSYVIGADIRKLKELLGV